MPETITATSQELAAAFELWQKKFEEDPSKFQKANASYGRNCAEYLVELIAEVRQK